MQRIKDHGFINYTIRKHERRWFHEMWCLMSRELEEKEKSWRLLRGMAWQKLHLTKAYQSSLFLVSKTRHRPMCRKMKIWKSQTHQTTTSKTSPLLPPGTTKSSRSLSLSVDQSTALR